MNKSQFFLATLLFLNLLITVLALFLGVYQNEQLFLIEISDSIIISLVLLYFIKKKGAI
jgi:hypothetical protein